MNLIDIDGNTYNIIKIGVQYWTVENLRTTNDGMTIIMLTCYIIALIAHIITFLIMMRYVW
jgi:hypothetical protein